MALRPADSDGRDPSPSVPSPPGGGRLARVHAWCVRRADWAHTHRAAVAALGAPAVVLALVAVNHWVLLDFPNSGDEYAYLYQAKTLAARRLWNPTMPAPEHFAFNYIVQQPLRTFGTFPFGWPLLLAAGAVAGLPYWLVNPLLGALTLALVWALGARLYHPRVGVLAAALVAVSPFFAFNAASYFSHTFCGVLLLGAACLAARDDRAPWWVPASIGLLIGWAVLARYLTGVAGAVPIVWWLLRPGVRRARAAALVAAGGLPWILALMAYDQVLNGSPWQLTMTTLTVSRWFAAGVLARGADIFATHVLRYVLWTPPVLVVSYVAALVTAPRGLRRGLLTWLPALMAGLLYFYVERGGNQYGPRFYYEAFPFLAVFVAAAVFRDTTLAAAPRERAWFAALAVSVALTPLLFIGHAVIERQVILERTDPFRLAAAAGLHDALVLIGGRVGTARSMAALDLTRNGIERDAAVLYGLDLGVAANCAARAEWPARTAYLYAWDAAAARGALRPLVCP